MVLSKTTFRAFLCAVGKISVQSSRNYNNIIYIASKRNKFNSSYSKFIVGSAAALGFSLYIAHKNKISCDIDLADVKIRNEIETYEEAISKSRDVLQRIKDEVGAPGIVIGVSINGKTIWKEGLGYSDVENRVLCSGDTVMRIASISKSITMAAVAKLWEQGKLDLDKPVQEYVPYFPQKNFDGKPVTITCRHLVSHLGGIRHYAKQPNDQKNDLKNGEEKSSTKKEVQKNEFEYKEYYIKENYKDVRSSVDIFKDDPLIAKPGSKFIYSTHAWTLISAIVEAAAKEQFRVHMTKLFKKLGMTNTYIDDNDVLIYHRSRNYIKAKNGYLINAPYVNNSYKLAGGGFLSTVGDLLHFGNAMLYSLQFKMTTQKMNDGNFTETSTCNQSASDKNIDCPNDRMSCTKQILPGYLNSKTVEAMWSPIADYKESKYGMGWAIFPESQDCQYCEENKYCVYHSGGAIGASSILLILPKECHNEEHIDIEFSGVPKGIVVSILTNLQSISLYKTALTIANIFDHKRLTMHNNE